MGTNVGATSPPLHNNAQMVQTSIPNMANALKKPPLFDADNQADDDKMTINSDFSRGSKISIKSKKLENLNKSVEQKSTAGIMKDEELMPLDNPSKSMNLALLDLQSKKNVVNSCLQRIKTGRSNLNPAMSSDRH